MKSRSVKRNAKNARKTPFQKSRASYFRFACFNTSPLYYLRAWHRLCLMGHALEGIQESFFTGRLRPDPLPFYNICNICKPEEGWYGQPKYCYKKKIHVVLNQLCSSLWTSRSWFLFIYHFWHFLVGCTHATRKTANGGAIGPVVSPTSRYFRLRPLKSFALNVRSFRSHIISRFANYFLSWLTDIITGRPPSVSGVRCCWSLLL